jgi:hypothetical protein
VWLDWERKTYPADVPAPGRTIERFEQLPALLPAPVRTT